MISIETLARVLDLAITEWGTKVIERSAAFEVLLRRLHAIVIADQQGNWEMACLLEEVPTAKTMGIHENIMKKLVNQKKKTAAEKAADILSDLIRNPSQS